MIHRVLHKCFLILSVVLISVSLQAVDGNVNENTQTIKSKVGVRIESLRSSASEYTGKFKSWWNQHDADDCDNGKASGFKIYTWGSQELLMIGGATALAAIVIGGITYILYKNGVFKKIHTAVKNNPTTVVVTTVALLDILFIMALIYCPYDNPIDANLYVVPSEF